MSKIDLKMDVVETLDSLRDHKIPFAIFLYNKDFVVSAAYSNGMPLHMVSCVKLYSLLMKEDWTEEVLLEINETVDNLISFNVVVASENKDFDVTLEYDIYIKDKMDKLKKYLDEDNQLYGFISYASYANAFNDHVGVNTNTSISTIDPSIADGNPLEMIKFLLSGNYKMSETKDFFKAGYINQIKKLIFAYGIMEDKIELP